MIHMNYAKASCVFFPRCIYSIVRQSAAMFPLFIVEICCVRQRMLRAPHHSEQRQDADQIKLFPSYAITLCANALRVCAEKVAATAHRRQSRQPHSQTPTESKATFVGPSDIPCLCVFHRTDDGPRRFVHFMNARMYAPNGEITSFDIDLQTIYISSAKTNFVETTAKASRSVAPGAHRRRRRRSISEGIHFGFGWAVGESVCDSQSRVFLAP